MFGLRASPKNPAGADQASANRRILEPRVDVRDTANALILVADLPGCDEASVELSVDKGTLTLRGIPKITVSDGLEPLWGEVGPIVYERSFGLPEVVDPDQTSATARNGVLTVVLAKRISAKPRRIAVSAA